MIGILLSTPLIIIGAYTAYKRPIISACIILAALPSFLISWRPTGVPLNTLDILIVVSVLFWAISHTNDIREMLQTYRLQIILLLLWVISASISIFFSPSPIDALGILKSYFILPVIFMLMLVSVIRNKQDFTYLLLALAFLVAYNALFALSQKISPGGLLGLNPITNPFWAAPATFRATGLLQYPNALGLLIAPLIPLLLGGIAIMKQQWQKVLLLLSALLGIATIYFAASKGAALGLSVAFVIFIFYYFKTHIKGILVLVALGALLLTPYMDTLISRAGFSSYSAQLRLAGWRETLMLLADNPIVGAGLAGFQKAVVPYHQIDFLEVFLYPHNIFLNFWVELGIFGLFIFFALLYTTIRKYRQLLRTTSEHKAGLLAAGIGALIILMVHGLVDVPFFKNDLAILFLIIWAWPFLVERVSAHTRL